MQKTSLWLLTALPFVILGWTAMPAQAAEQEAAAVAGLSDQLTELDTDKDAKLSESEFSAFEGVEEGSIKQKLKQMLE